MLLKEINKRKRKLKKSNYITQKLMVQEEINKMYADQKIINNMEFNNAIDRKED